MKTVYIDYLFNKNFFVAQNNGHSNQTSIWISLAKLFNIEVQDHFELLEPEMIQTAEDNLGIDVPEPFYRGFPESVKQLTPDELLIDQVFHYMTTYGMGDFSETRHSIFEKEIKRKVFDEEAEIKKFSILTESEAVDKIAEYTDQLLKTGFDLPDTIVRIFLVQINKYLIQNLCDQFPVLILEFQLLITISFINVMTVPVQCFRKFGNIKQRKETIKFRIPQINDQFHRSVL